jgi:hypothetical protein
MDNDSKEVRCIACNYSTVVATGTVSRALREARDCAGDDDDDVCDVVGCSIVAVIFTEDSFSH